MIVFVVRRGPIWGPRGIRGVPEASQGLPQRSQGRSWGVSGTSLMGPRAVPGDSRGVPKCPRGVPRGSPGSQGARDVLGIPWILFIKMIPEYNSIISFRNMIP